MSFMFTCQMTDAEFEKWVCVCVLACTTYICLLCFACLCDVSWTSITSIFSCQMTETGFVKRVCVCIYVCMSEEGPNVSVI
jgi:hypothetical protein